MPTFTAAQASGSYILRSKKLFHDGVLRSWEFNVSGSDGFEHCLTDTTLSVSASLQEQKNAIMAILTGSIEYVQRVEPIISSSLELTYNDDAISLA